ncbi:hypothetical protein F0562_011655 [Nyssa sinensis]|uniref:Uncharacterized protein n=1 Tax=Nyssa sinensis TaxID=561372 RepID=A0A5J4ZUB3_9ASTE|nr:hypothetical protein F0562_011655 [Nyssa sinensis]
METETSSCSVSAPQQSSNYDELFMQHSLLFADSLKDLKNIRKQLHSAADYFEQSYCKDDQKRLVLETVKDYVTKALISTVDHLGSVAYKVNNFLDEKVDQVSATKLRFSCIEQRFRTHQDFINYGGFSQQLLAIKTPKYHRHYIIPDPTHADDTTKSVYNNCILSAEDNLQQSKNAIQATMVEPRPSLIRKRHSRLPSMESSSTPVTFSFTRAASSKGRSISPNPSNAKQRYPSEPRRSFSLSTHAERDRTKEIEQYSKKSRGLFRALLSMHKSKNAAGD